MWSILTFLSHCKRKNDMARNYLLKVLILMPFTVALSGGCKERQVSESIVPEIQINFPQCIQKKWDEIPDSLLGEKKYVLLDTTQIECDFGEMSKVVIRHDRIYILDEYLKKLVVYDTNGKGIGQVGRKGQGPEEYLNICDFDVASDGDIFFIDGRLDRLFCFGKDLCFKYRKDLPFEADIVSVLDNGDFLFGLSSWNTGKYKQCKVVRTDANLNVDKIYLKYDAFFDPTYWISNYSFIRSADCISYNQPIDNHIYLFDETGVLSKCINFDFGNQNVPNDCKKDIEKHLSSFDRYCLLKNFVAITDRIIAGTFWIRRMTVPFVFDRSNNICYLSEPKENYEHSCMAGYSNSLWITCLEPDMGIQEFVPDSVLRHVEKGGFVLGMQPLY